MDAVGDLFCGSVDIAAFQRDCRAPLFPNVWNRWILARSTFDQPGALDIERQVPAILSRWFADVSMEGGVVRPGKPGFGPSIDNVRFRILDAAERQKLGLGTANRSTVCDTPMFLRSGGAMFVLVEFIPRLPPGDADMPWPVHKVQMVNPWCPRDAEWMLDVVLKPLTLTERAVPAEQSVTEQLSSQASQAAQAARGLLPTFSGPQIAGGIALAMLALFVAAKGLK